MHIIGTVKIQSSKVSSNLSSQTRMKYISFTLCIIIIMSHKTYMHVLKHFKVIDKILYMHDLKHFKVIDKILGWAWLLQGEKF